MNENRLFMRFEHNCLLILSFEERRKQVRTSCMDTNLIPVATESRDTGDLLDHIVAVLAKMRICGSDRKKRKTRDRSPLSNLSHLRRASSRRWLVGVPSSRKQETHTPCTVMCMMDCHPCYLTTPGEMMLLSYGLGPHS
jgi:hypothetical protein